MRLSRKRGLCQILKLALLAGWSAGALAELTRPPSGGATLFDAPASIIGVLPDYATVARVNRQVNESTRYEADTQRFGRSDLWVEANGAGDCEDFVLEKRRRLLALGVPPPAMRIVTARIKTSQFGRERGHAVLVVLTTEGEWVLDMTGEPARKQDLSYRWMKIQQGGRWYSVEN